MTRGKKALSIVLSSMLLIITLFSNLPASAAKVPYQIPQIKYASAPVTEYYAGDRIRFDIYAPNYGGKVEYRVILWNDSLKTYYDLWNAENGYPNRYYTKWQPNGNTVFTLGWPIFDPGYYRITVLVKRLGIPNNKTALKGMNCDSYMESVAFLVKPTGGEVDYILPVGDVSITQGNTPQLPQTVRAVMKDSTEKNLRVNWEYVDTSSTGVFSIRGNVEGTDKKAMLRLIVTPRTLNLYTVAALNEACVNVILRDAIDYMPDVSRFYIIGNNSVPVRIYTLNLSQDRKVIQLITEVMVYGQWYKLSIDGKDFSYQIPNPVVNKISIGEIEDLGIEAGKQGTVNVYTSPDNTILTAASSNKNVATVEVRDRKLIIKGIDAGAATITLTAKRDGYESSSKSFSVIVNKLTASPDRVDEDRSFDNIIQLEIKGYGSLRRDFTIYDVSLGGDFAGLNVQLPNVLDIQTNKVRIRLVGNLVYKNGYGTITLSQRAWNGPYNLTTRVNVNTIKQVSKPVALPESGEVGPGTQVIIYSPTSGAKVYYTTDGSTPTGHSTEFVNPIAINKSTRIKAIAIKAGMKDSDVSTFMYTIKESIPIKQVSKPAAVPDSGEVALGAQIVLYSPTSGAKVYYTTDGSTPTVRSTEFVNPIAINKSTRIKAIAIKAGMKDSEVSTFMYTIKESIPIKQVSKPAAVPDSGEVALGAQVVLYSPTSGAKVYYTTDGSTPTVRSTEFVNPIVINKSIKIKAIAIKSGMKDSEISTFVYTVKIGTPKPVTIQDGEFRAVQGNVIGKTLASVYIQKQDKGKWTIIGSTNEEGSNGQLKGFFVIDKTPFAVVDNSKAGLIIVTPKEDSLAEITGYMDSDGQIQYGEYRAVHGNVIGDRKERIYIQKYTDGKWKTISSTRGSGDNGKLTGFFVMGKTPYAIIKYNDSGDIIVTPHDDKLDDVAGKVVWD